MQAVLQFRGASSAVIFILPSVIRREALLKEILRAEIRGWNILRAKSARSVHMQMIFQPQGDRHRRRLLGIFLQLKASTVANPDDNVSLEVKISGN